RKNFVASLETMPRLYRGQARLTMLESYRSRRDLDQKVGELNRVAGESAFTEVPVLIELATREIERGALSDGRESTLDFADASRNLSRVLTMDEQSAAAKNQVARLHLAKAKAVASVKPAPAPVDGCRDETA